MTKIVAGGQSVASVGPIAGSSAKSGQEIVRDVITKLFGADKAKLVSFFKSADGKEELCRADALPHIDKGWAGGGITFKTLQGDKSQQDVQSQVTRALTDAGLPSIWLSLAMLESTGG
jgi:hypothetical protein